MTRTEREAMWRRLDAVGLEHVRVEPVASGITASGLVLGVEAGRVYRFEYEIRTDARGHVTRFRVTDLLSPGALDLHADGDGAWFDDGRELEALRDCLDLDFAVTPFTNTLPVRRLGLDVGASAEIDVVYIDAPEVVVRRARQRYTRLPDGPTGRQFRFEALDSGYTNVVTVDEMGLVLAYPDLFERAL